MCATVGRFSSSWADMCASVYIKDYDRIVTPNSHSLVGYHICEICAEMYCVGTASG